MWTKNQAEVDLNELVRFKGKGSTNFGDLLYVCHYAEQFIL